MTPNELIALSIQRERDRAEWTLSELAQRAGIAKSTLSQLEAGKGNPSVETLWAIASALDVPVSFLFDTPSPQTTLIRANQGARVVSDVAGFEATLLANCPPGLRRDLYRVHLTRSAADQARLADPHPPGVVEHVFVCSGTVRAGPETALQDLSDGDYYRYPGDVPHRYEAVSPTALIVMVMETPR